LAEITAMQRFAGTLIKPIGFGMIFVKKFFFLLEEFRQFGPV